MGIFCRSSSYAKLAQTIALRRAAVPSVTSVCERLQSSAAVVSEPKWTEIYTTNPIDHNESTFSKILIANRGEIACRVMHTARRMGIKTVAIHSDVDSNSLFVRMADEAVCVGKAPTSQSYLNVDAILRAIDSTGAEAVHPGYGFLSENTKFAAILESKGVKFIGPNSDAIIKMGDKIESKRLAKGANVSFIPGYDGEIKSEEHCIEISKKIGYPVMIKASAGGGGKGMRIARNDKEAREGFRLSQQEAKSSFGDDRMLVEKYVVDPRHIEVQFMGDKHGNAVYLNERECSIQRRNQKVIEEAPSPFVDPEMRKRMGTQAVTLAKHVGYDSAGTVEFLVDNDKNFYFLEMNTRLQVEHPISECITGIDLVYEMIRVAKGHPLKVTQDQMPLRGWAIESRVYAEDPSKNFGLPSIGRLSKYRAPSHIDGVRCDSGIEEGSEISIYYDPMICKLITYGKTRAECIEKQIQALDDYVIRGVTHNIPLLRDIFTEKRFCSGDINTGYLPSVYPDGFQGKSYTPAEKKDLIAISAAMHAKDALRSGKFINAEEPTIKAREEYLLTVHLADEQAHCLVKCKPGAFDVHLDGQVISVKDNFNLAEDVSHMNVGSNKHTIQLINRKPNGTLRIRFLGTALNVKVMSAEADRFLKLMPDKPKADFSKTVQAPMPGLVKSVSAKVGQMIPEGQEVCVIEAMKMQNSLTAAVTGKVKAVNVKPGDTVEDEQVLIEFE
ncbi:unnamed protein product [Notodromas monacha]|uniref:Propionyl-CoA carboxylase alpha chain, mitochondrial n=1 Tax=Notodromas monacha TaxID=399045 RepID=A0A7R9GAF5_9CRUS|nr:unnamed protein product [Notodromas monacha]CAG0915309.1 unnamed protein product [Notodromas monacha]